MDIVIIIMCSTMVNNRRCKIPTKSDYCHIHIRLVVTATADEVAKLKDKIVHQSKELTIMNTRLSDALRKLQLIEVSDYIKYALTPMAINRSFKSAIRDPLHAKAVEEIFGVEIDKCESIYDELLTKRNMIVHKYTHQAWSKKSKIPSHGKSVKKLISSIKTYELLREGVVAKEESISREPTGPRRASSPLPRKILNAWSKPLQVK